MSAIADVDIEADLTSQIVAVAATGGEIEIIGGGSKRFYGESFEALPVDVSGHSGIIDYDPAELVITLRAGCKLSDVEAPEIHDPSSLPALLRGQLDYPEPIVDHSATRARAIENFKALKA